LILALLRNTCLHILVKGHISVMCVTRDLLNLAKLGDIWLHILVKDHKYVMSVASVKSSLLRLANLLHMLTHTNLTDATFVRSN